jgi:tight adherence protein B
MTVTVAVMSATGAAWAAAGARRSGSRRLHLSPPSPGRRWWLVVTGSVAAAAAAGVSVVLLLGGAGIAAGLLVLQRRRQQRRLRSDQDADVVLLCFALADELRAGRLTADAFAAVAPLLRVLTNGMAEAARAMGHGAPVDDELRLLAAAQECPRLLSVAAVWTAAATTGARVADVLEWVGRGFTADDEAAAELDALSAGPRATALVLCLLPVFALVLGTALGASPLPVLLHTTLGAGLVAASLVLDVAGLLWVRRITAAALNG